MTPLPVVRCILHKGPEARFIGHLDLARAVERAIRRAGLPLAHTEGFNPRPRIAFASALALGATSEGEVVEITMREPVPAQEILARLAPQMPPGLAMAAAREVPPGSPSPFPALAWADYRLAVSAGPASTGAPGPEWAGLVDAFLEQRECLVEREGKDGRPALVNVRPLVRRLEVTAGRGAEAELYALVRAGGEANLRPEELARALGNVAGRPVVLGAVHRLALYGEKAGRLVPLFDF